MNYDESLNFKLANKSCIIQLGFSVKNSWRLKRDYYASLSSDAALNK